MQEHFAVFQKSTYFRHSIAPALFLAALTPSVAQPIFTTAPAQLQGIQPAPAIQKTRPDLATETRPEAGPDVRLAPRPEAQPPASQAPKLSTAEASSSFAQRKKPAHVIRHLTNNIQGFRLSGEIGSSEWPVYFTQAQALQKLQFQLGYLTAVSVMPEASNLKLIVNDTLVGRATIRPTQTVRDIVYDIPPGVIQPGFNSVRIVAEQRHRVDCSLNATYELWTQIDPSRTGFILPPGDAGPTTFNDLAALPPNQYGALPIRLVLPAQTSPEHIERSIRAAQTVSLLGRFEQPVVDVGELAGGQYGINIVVGSARSIADILSATRSGAVDGPRAIVTPASQGRRTTIILTGRDDEEVGTAVTRLAQSEQLRGSPAGLRAARAFPGYRIEGGQRVKLRDIGISSEEFSGRLFRIAFNVIMPPDFYAADYGKATLDIAGGYAAGLTNAAQIVLSVNGRNAVSQKLPKSGGEVFKQNPIPLQLGHLRPGLNRIEIEAQVPVPEDEAACDPLAAVKGRNRFLLLDSTEIEIPSIARIARVPDLAVTAVGGFPFLNSERRPNLYVPSPDRDSLGAAATFAAHLAIAAGAPVDFRLATTRPLSGSGPTLAVAPFMSIEEDLMTAVGLKREDILKHWQERLDETPKTESESLSEWEQLARNRLVLQRNFPAVCHMPKPAGGFSHAFAYDRMPVASTQEPKPQRDLFAEWDNRVRSQSRIMGYVSGAVRTVNNMLRGTYTDARIWIDKQLESAAFDPINSGSSLIIAQNILGRSTDHVWTLVTAPNSALLAQSMGCLVDPRVWRQIGGKVSVLNADDGTVGTIAATDTVLVATQPLSVGNLRLIVAGWFSLNSKFYVLCALLLALCLATSTHVFLRNVGRRPE